MKGLHGSNPTYTGLHSGNVARGGQFETCAIWGGGVMGHCVPRVS